MGALDLDGFEFLVLDDQVLALGDLVAAALVLGADRLTGFLIDRAADAADCPWPC